jgi:hypothetical protein
MSERNNLSQYMVDCDQGVTKVIASSQEDSQRPLMSSGSILSLLWRSDRVLEFGKKYF